MSPRVLFHKGRETNFVPNRGVNVFCFNHTSPECGNMLDPDQPSAFLSQKQEFFPALSTQGLEGLR
jgi:hypothetical protein